MLNSIEWGEFRLGDLFEIVSYKKRFDANKVVILKQGKHPYIVRMGSNNGQRGYIDEDNRFLNEGNTISFGQDTATMYYQEKPYFTGDKIKILKPKHSRFNKNNAQFFLAAMRRPFNSFAWGSSSFNVDIIENQYIQLPITQSKEIHFDFMETFIAELETERVAELSAYLKISGLDDYMLTEEEQSVLDNYNELEWGTFNLEKLYGKSTRGKRLKSADRIPGDLPFVTAGEADEGISAFIGNSVHVFSSNTTTIDMFGSAKYRSYEYGGDDHVAIVHTEKLPVNAAIFVTSAINKSSHNGQFDYGKNFYAKDADILDIKLPIKNGKPDYDKMAMIISAIRKLVIKDVVQFSDEKIKVSKQIITERKEISADMINHSFSYEYTHASGTLMVAEESSYNKNKRNR